MDSSLVSCIIPTKNRADLLEKAIESVLAQTHKNVEIIVVDDSTTDETEKMLGNKKLPVKYFKNGKSMGAPFSRNVGIDTAKGQYLAFLDDDHAWLPKKLELQLQALKDSSIVSCNYYAAYTNKVMKVQIPEIVTLESMLTKNHLGSCSFVMVERSAVGNIRFDENLKSCQDWDMWLQIMIKNKIQSARCLQNYLVNYNNGDHERISHRLSRIDDYIFLQQKYCSMYDKKMLLAFYSSMLLVLACTRFEKIMLYTLYIKNSDKSFVRFIVAKLKRLVGIIDDY